ncbi:TRAP transporter small permease [Oceanobacter antarcticus]|jgi:TRAP-type C4-dicarboxylate transport system permease small subunit|uniref:TRAP transporter small permease protein n=1 Tax=Oceanobacter antarcticus TaxID=3133425 RepID=A0ABW8NKY1_9GAMM|tara:strand:- start:18376 stop:18927 length:552 start_codon:yes stop_codon:yes gene_type:complete
MKQLENWIGRLTIWIGCTILILMVLQIVIDVAMRSLLGAGFPATSELVSKYYMVAVSFLPIAYAEIRRRHVEATIFTDKLPPRAKLLVTLMGFILSLLVYAVLCWGTLVEAIANTSKGSYVESGVDMFYTWPSYWVLPVSFGLMVLVLLLRVITSTVELVTNRIQDHGHDPDMMNVTLAQVEE